MNDDLSREEILNYLSICFCIMVLYYDDAISERRKDQSHRNNEGVPYCLFNIDFAVNYMGCAWSVITPLTDNRAVRTASKFIRTIQFQMLSSMILI